MHIDYIAASFTIAGDLSDMVADLGKSVLTGVIPATLLDPVNLETDGVPVHRRPYRTGVFFDNGWRVFWGGHTNILVEITGRGCAAINPLTYLANLLQLQHDRLRLLRITRLDIAEDYQTDLSPFDAVTQWGINDRIKTRNVHNSQSGQTFYVGSRRSDRFVRVYRYNEPHPRADSLRVEFQFNKTVAGKIVDKLVSREAYTDDIFRGAAQATFKNYPSRADLPAASVTRTHERGKAGSVVWVHRQVIPALKNLIASGEITLNEILGALTNE
jgi:DNA relaxase NicK